MKRVGIVLLSVVCFALGAIVQRTHDARRLTTPQVVQTVPTAPQPEAKTPEAPPVNVAAIEFEDEPLWAYGFDTQAKPADKAAPQAPPNRNLRPNQDRRRNRRASGLSTGAARTIHSWTFATARTSSTGSRAITRRCRVSWRMVPRDSERRRAAAGPATCRTAKGARKTPPSRACPSAYFMRQIQDFRAGLRHTRRSAQAEYEHDDRAREGHDRRRTEVRQLSISAR